MGLLIDVGSETISAEGAAANIDITFTPKASGNLILDGLSWPNADGTPNQFLQTNGSGVLSFATVSGGPTFNDDVFRVNDDGDVTKQIAFQASAITTSTVRTITMPDQNVDLTPTTGTFQASDAGLTDIAGLAVTDGNFIVGDGANWVAESGSTVAQSIGGVTQDLDTLGAPSADGEFIVATGAGAFAYESGATVRTSLGLGTGDSPQFTAIELGHASDTTLSRGSAGVLHVEGVPVLLEPTGFKQTKFTTQTTDGTQTVIGSIAIADDETHFVTIKGLGRENATGDSIGVKIEILIRREGATTTLVGEPIRTVINQAGSTSWDIDAVADDTGDELDIRVTGEASHTIDWIVKTDAIQE